MIGALLSTALGLYFTPTVGRLFAPLAPAIVLGVV
jgi:hypothetical protein